MRRIRGENHPAALRLYAHGLKPHRVAADEMNAEPGRQLLGPVVKLQPPVEEAANHGSDVLDLEGSAKHAVAHAAPSAELHLLVLDVIASIGEEVGIAG